MSAVEEFINTLTDEEIEYLEKTVFTDEGDIISKEKLESLIAYETMMNAQKDAIQYSLKINLNSVDVCAAA